MDSMYKAFETLPKRLDSLDVNIGRKLDLVNVHIKNASQRTTALEMQDNQDSMFKAIEALSKRLDSLGTNMERKLDLVNVNVMNMSERTTTLEMKGILALINKTIEAWYASPHSFNKSVVRKLDVVIKSIEELSLQFKNTSETIKALAMQGIFWNIPEHFMNVTIFSSRVSCCCCWKTLEKTVSLGHLLTISIVLSLGDTLYSLYNKEVEFVGLHNSSVAGYTLQFLHKGNKDHVIITRGMPNLSAVTVCLWIKTTDNGNGGTPLSYVVSGARNELLLFDYRNFEVYINNHGRFEYFI
ncbi:unnamed protein product [Pocillopora meandrina]|uniref:Pentraxin (PTX) domain-containing protein n=1 Tax=Pocillopora meandrina TaxID=46732 RepID=A0AAU9WM43_9CNID|nr:unnamed protein product [Pocillopora meandrina]